MTPFGGYGANLAIADGLELAAAFARAPRNPPEQVLRLYESKAMRRGLSAASRSELLASVLCMEGAAATWLRNLFLPGAKLFQ